MAEKMALILYVCKVVSQDLTMTFVTAQESSLSKLIFSPHSLKPRIQLHSSIITAVFAQDMYISSHK